MLSQYIVSSPLSILEYAASHCRSGWLLLFSIDHERCYGQGCDGLAEPQSLIWNIQRADKTEAVEKSGLVRLTLKKDEDNWLLHKVIVPENLVEKLNSLKTDFCF